MDEMQQRELHKEWRKMKYRADRPGSKLCSGFVCGICEMHFRGQQKFLAHCNEIHRSKGMVKKNVAAYESQCRNCLADFDNPKAYWQHRLGCKEQTQGLKIMQPLQQSPCYSSEFFENSLPQDGARPPNNPCSYSEFDDPFNLPQTGFSGYELQPSMLWHADSQEMFALNSYDVSSSATLHEYQPYTVTTMYQPSYQVPMENDMLTNVLNIVELTPSPQHESYIQLGNSIVGVDYEAPKSDFQPTYFLNPSAPVDH
ncbi:hypothetical protein Ciccas_007191 [Cichlidogyrus casuarinus]|uniref:C2H2-type domain-containing protein n=1 Tax=Cichlidogyrus casuarinus TaxID=1844966 RepID=A0ABD2Q4Q9_9PLAT